MLGGACCWHKLTVSLAVVLVGRNLDTAVVIRDDVVVSVELSVLLVQSNFRAVACAHAQKCHRSRDESA
jgi:hypothetical protein